MILSFVHLFFSVSPNSHSADLRVHTHISVKHIFLGLLPFCVACLQIHPHSGPSKGGTRLTVLGKNLGKLEDEVVVDVDGVRCIVQEFFAPRK